MFISSSLKDGMCLYELGYNFCCPISETTRISKEIWNDLNNRFSKVVFLLDNDEAGVNWMKQMNSELGASYAILPQLNGAKDVADIVQHHGQDKLRSILQNLKYHD